MVLLKGPFPYNNIKQRYHQTTIYQLFYEKAMELTILRIRLLQKDV